MVERILVALDNSQTNDLVFEEALTLAQQHQAQLIIVHILSTDERDPSPLTDLIPYSPSASREQLVERYQEQLLHAEHQCLATLHAFAEKARATGIVAECIQQVGNPRKLICYLAQDWNVELIVMGQRQRSWLSRCFLGGVSQAVVRRAPCPVHIVRLTGESASPPPQHHQPQEFRFS